MNQSTHSTNYRIYRHRFTPLRNLHLLLQQSVFRVHKKFLARHVGCGAGAGGLVVGAWVGGFVTGSDGVESMARSKALGEFGPIEESLPLVATCIK